jgi:hypothetical protein
VGGAVGGIMRYIKRYKALNFYFYYGAQSV